MSIEQALIAQPRSDVIASAARALLARELSKGCWPELASVPVALEPPYARLSSRPGQGDADADVAGEVAVPIPANKLARLRIWVSPEQTCDWQASERFLKQLLSVEHRISFELTGNREGIELALTCHQRDLAVVRNAFHAEFDVCKLTFQTDNALVRLPQLAWSSLVLEDFFPPPPYSHLFTRPDELRTSPLASVITALADLPPSAAGLYQLLAHPVDKEHDWHHNVQALLDWEFNLKLLTGLIPLQRYPLQMPSGDLRHMAMDTETKAHPDKPFFAAALRIAIVGAEDLGTDALRALAVFSSLIQHGGRPLSALSEDDYEGRLSRSQVARMLLEGHSYHAGFLLNSWELTSLLHVPPAHLLQRRKAPTSVLETLRPEAALDRGTPVGICDDAGCAMGVCIPLDTRMEHTHLIGTTGQGKSTVLLHMLLDDIERGEGIALLDPHGRLVDDLLSRIPVEHIPRVIYIDPGDRNWVPLWNPLRCVSGQDLGRVADDLVGAFRAFVTGWGHRLEHLLRHAILAVLHLPDGTLQDVADLLRKKSGESERLRSRVAPLLESRLMRSFWQQDFLGYGNADLSPPQHKLSRLLASGNVSYMLSQPENRIDFREVMDTGKILVVNLANIGSETREVLGCFMLSLLRLAAISRSDIPPPAQMRFHVYCDEAHRFITDAIEDLIEETRKYNVSLALAHQYMSQFSTRKSDAISGVGTTIMFRVNTVDATFLRKDLQGKVDVDALTNLAKYEAIARIGTEVVKLKTRKAPPLPANDPRGLIIERSRQLYYRRLWDLNPGPRVRECHAPLNFDPSGAADDAVDESPEMYAYQEL